MPIFTASLLLALMIGCGGGSSVIDPPPPTLTLGQAAAHHNIKVGAAADSPYLTDNSYATILGSEFSQLQAENEMKFGIIHPASGTYDSLAVMRWSRSRKHIPLQSAGILSFGTTRYRPGSRWAAMARFS
jgi:GH35 family endo-1,4-beta-xylanase